MRSLLNTQPEPGWLHQNSSTYEKSNAKINPDSCGLMLFLSWIIVFCFWSLFRRMNLLHFYLICWKINSLPYSRQKAVLNLYDIYSVWNQYLFWVDFAVNVVSVFPMSVKFVFLFFHPPKKYIVLLHKQ